jgi:hypothetical protein
MMTNGRMLRSAKLLSAGKPGINTNGNNSSWCRSKRFAKALQGCSWAKAYWAPKLHACV